MLGKDHGLRLVLAIGQPAEFVRVVESQSAGVS